MRTKLTIAKAMRLIISPTIAPVMVLLAFFVVFSLPAEVVYIIPPTIKKITDRLPAIPSRALVTILASSAKLAGPPSVAGAVMGVITADSKNIFNIFTL